MPTTKTRNKQITTYMKTKVIELIDLTTRWEYGPDAPIGLASSANLETVI